MFNVHALQPLALAALITALPSVTLATTASPLTLEPAHRGDKVSLAFNFEGHFGPNRDDLLKDVISIQQKKPGVVSVGATKCKPFALDTTIDEAGLLAQPSTPSSLGDIIIDYNSIVKIAQHAKHEAGAQWQTQIPVRLSPDTWEDVPVNVTATSVSSDGLTIAATGHAELSLYFQGYTFPVDVTVHMDELFGPDGQFANAALAVNEITAGGSGPPISYAWHLTAK